jgi:hypothetical protein
MFTPAFEVGYMFISIHYIITLHTSSLPISLSLSLYTCAYKNTHTICFSKIVLRKLPTAAINVFLGDDTHAKALSKLDPVEQRLLDIAMFEFEVWSHYYT